VEEARKDSAEDGGAYRELFANQIVPFIGGIGAGAQG
jgi:hypothetical protein